MLLSLFLTGAAMSAATQEPPPKSELPPLKKPFDTRVKVEVIDPKTKAVDYTVENVDALLHNGKWRVRYHAKNHVRTHPPAGSRITNDMGEVWVIDSAKLNNSGGVSWYQCEVTKQDAAPKKEPPKKSSPKKEV